MGKYDGESDVERKLRLKLYRRDLRANNLEREKEKRRAYREANKISIDEYRRKNREKNREYQQKHREKAYVRLGVLNKQIRSTEDKLARLKAEYASVLESTIPVEDREPEG